MYLEELDRDDLDSNIVNYRFESDYWSWIGLLLLKKAILAIHWESLAIKTKLPIHALELIFSRQLPKNSIIDRLSDSRRRCWILPRD